MKTKDIIKNMKTFLEEDNIESIDELLHEIFSSELQQEQEESIWDLLQEITLYSELREDEYKQEALNIINNLYK